MTDPATSTAALPTAAERVADVPLIPREALFGNPSRAAATISHDGHWLGWLAPHDEVLNVWVAPTGDPAQARLMTRSIDRPIPAFFFAPDSASVLYIQDKAGDENYLIYQVDLASGEERTLTPFENTRARFYGVSHAIKDRVLIGLNNRDPRFHDAYMLNLESGALELVRENDSYAGFLADDTLTLRWALRQNAAGGTDMFEIANGQVADTPRVSTDLEDSMTTHLAGYSADGTTLYWIDSRGRDTAALFAEDTATGRRTLIAEDAKADVMSTMRHPLTGVVEAYAVNYLKTEWIALDDGVRASLDWLRERLPGEFGVQARTDDDSKWIVGHDPLTGPAVAYLYDRAAHTLTELYVTRPELVGAPLQPTHALEIPTRDGLRMVSYLTLPPGADPDGDGLPGEPVPLVLFVHGGPWARDVYGFNRAHQWLANRGYAVLSVNFRGVGSSRVDLQACKLEYSIVSPK